MSKWAHVVGVAGSTTSSTALLLRDLGYNVTGSDKGFFPPISDYLKHHDFEVMPGYKAERLTNEQGQHPDLIVYRGTLSEQNPEIEFARQNNIPIKTFTDIIVEHLIVPNHSLVVTGTYGKTTITSLLIKIFENNHTPINYMVGGLFADFKQGMHKSDNAEYSIIEGDEYLTSLEDTQSKFFKYKASHLIINSIKWDHPDLFKTEADYIDNFKKLVEQLPETGLLVANANDKNVVTVAQQAKCKVIYYSVDEKQAQTEAEWVLIRESEPLPTLVRKPLIKDAEIIPYERKVIGKFNDENILAASALAYELGVSKERIQDAVAEYTGIKRRLEIRSQSDKYIVIDDFGSSPPKAKGAITALREEFPDAELTIIFEPNTGNRTEQSLETYDNAFTGADLIILPKFTKIPRTEEKKFGAGRLQEYLTEKGVTTKFIMDDAQLVDELVDKAINSNKFQVIAFLGSHSFRQMMESLIEKLKI